MSVAELISVVVVGLALSSIFFLISVGLSLSYGLMRIVSLDQFLYYSIGAYTTYVVTANYGNFWVGLIAGMIASCVVALSVEKGLFRRIYEKGTMFSMIISYGVLLVGIGLTKYIFGLSPRPVISPVEGHATFLGLSLPLYRFLVIFISLAVYIALRFFLERTIVGKAIRAGIEDVDKTEGLGINVYNIFTLVFLLTAALSAAAGGLHAPMIMVDPHMGLRIISTAFMIVIIGGLGSIKGTVISSLIIGQVMSLGFVIWAPAAEMAPFVIMLVIFLVRPTGLYGSQFLTR